MTSILLFLLVYFCIHLNLLPKCILYTFMWQSTGKFFNELSPSKVLTHESDLGGGLYLCTTGGSQSNCSLVACTALHCWVVDGASAKLFTSWVLCTSEAPWPCQGHPGLLLHLCMQMSNANAGRSAHQMIFESNPIILKAIDPEVCFVMIWPKRLILPTEICLRNPTQ